MNLFKRRLTSRYATGKHNPGAIVVFAAALLNSQPMGFYQPAQIVRNAEEHGIKVLPIDVNHSYWDNTLEAKRGEHFSLRLGFRQIKEIRQAEIYQQPVLTLSRADEKGSPFVPIDKPLQTRQPAPGDYLDKGRNFK